MFRLIFSFCGLAGLWYLGQNNCKVDIKPSYFEPPVMAIIAAFYVWAAHSNLNGNKPMHGVAAGLGIIISASYWLYFVLYNPEVLGCRGWAALVVGASAMIGLFLFNFVADWKKISRDKLAHE